MQSGDTHPIIDNVLLDVMHCRRRKLVLMGDRKEHLLVTCSYQEGFPAPCTAYLRGDPMREVGGVGLLPALCRRRTACRRNVLRSRRNMTVYSLPGAVMVRDIIGLSDFLFFLVLCGQYEVIFSCVRQDFSDISKTKFKKSAALTLDCKRRVSLSNESNMTEQY